MAYVLTIAGTTKTIQPGWTISETINGIDTFVCEVVSADGTYRPALDAEVILTESGTTIFGGYVDKPSEHGTGGLGRTPITTRINAVGYRALPVRRVVNTTIATGNLKAALTTLVTYLSSYGVTLDAAQANGPTLEALTYEDRRLDTVLDELASVTGYVWQIDSSKKLRMFSVGTLTAPFSVTTANRKAVGDVTVDQSREHYANRVIVRAGAGTQNTSQSFTANGSDISWTTDLSATTDWPIFVLNGSPVPIGPYEPGVGASLWAYQWDPDTHTIYQRSGDAAATAGTTLAIFFTAQYPFRVTVDDAVEQAAHGIWDAVIEAPDAFTVDSATDIGTGYLAQVKFAPQSVRYETQETGVHPGQTQTVTVSQRNLNASFLVTDVQTRSVQNQVFRMVTGVSGSIYPGSWRDVYRQWSGMGDTSAPVYAGTLANVEGDLVANRGEDGTGNVYEASLRGTASRGSAAGPALRLGPLFDTNSWAVFADMLTAVGNGIALYQVPQVSSNFALRLGQFPSGGTHDFVLHHTSSSATFKIGAPTSLGLGGIGQTVDAIYTKDLDVSNGLTERSRTAKMGEWTAVAFSAGNYSADTGSWTVASGDITADLAYMIIGKTMFLNFAVILTSTSGSPNYLKITLPASATVATGRRYDSVSVTYTSDASTYESAKVLANTGDAFIRIYRYPSFSAFPNVTDTLQVQGQAVVPIA